MKYLKIYTIIEIIMKCEGTEEVDNMIDILEKNVIDPEVIYDCRKTM